MPTGTVKWFNRDKGFGFITPDEGEADIFVHISALEKAGVKMLAINDQVRFEVRVGENNRLVADELSLLEPDVEIITGKVKWFDAERGFGFIQRDDGGDDVFLHISVVQVAGLSELAPDQPVSFGLRPALDGRMTAARLSLL